MLYLARKPNEAVMIGTNIKVFVKEIKNGVVNLGFIAPKHISIDREEVFEQKLRNRRVNDDFYSLEAK